MSHKVNGERISFFWVLELLGAIWSCLVWRGLPREMWEMSHTSASWVIAVCLTSHDSSPSLLPNVTWAHVNQHLWQRHCTGSKLNSLAYTTHICLLRKQVSQLQNWRIGQQVLINAHKLSRHAVERVYERNFPTVFILWEKKKIGGLWVVRVIGCPNFLICNKRSLIGMF